MMIMIGEFRTTSKSHIDKRILYYALEPAPLIKKDKKDKRENANISSKN
jgi:prenyltransferase beta subunit